MFLCKGLSVVTSELRANTTILYVLIGVSALILIGVIAYKRRHKKALETDVTILYYVYAEMH